MTSPGAAPSSRRRVVVRAAATAGLGALGWLGLTEGDPASWIVGAPAVAMAAWLAAHAAPEGRAPAAAGLRPAQAPGFALWLLGRVFAAAALVALRVARPRVRVSPGLILRPLRLRGAAARAVYMNAVTLTPGTLSAALEGDRLAVHALDSRGPLRSAAEAELDALEARVARLFGETPDGTTVEARP